MADLLPQMASSSREYRTNVLRSQSPIIAKWRINNIDRVNWEKLEKSEDGKAFLSYFDSIPDHLQDLIHVTSHVREGTRHQTGLAMDLRIYDKENPENDPLFKFMAYDLSRQDKKIAILNPFHGTAPH